MRTASKHISLAELNKNPSTAHRLVEICSRYRSFSTEHAQLPNSTPIFSELADSGAERRDESNEVCLVAGRRFVPEISSFYYCACVATANCATCACADENADISGTKRRPETRHMSLDSSRRAASESANSEEIGPELRNCACAEVKRRYLVEISTNLCADGRF